MKNGCKVVIFSHKKVTVLPKFQSYLFQTNIFNGLTIYKNIIEHYVKLSDIFVYNMIIYVNKAFNNDL